MQFELPFRKQPGILRASATHLPGFGERVDFYFVPEGGDRMTGVSFLEPVDGVTLVNQQGLITKF